MTNKTYLELANTAIQNEKEEKYDLAAIEWGEAKNVATSLNAQLWAEYRQEHNEKKTLIASQPQQGIKKPERK
ncbi:ANR family transcriptional regulator [Xenorhabdus nematophila]|uniref:ANR family transcriptional regulator n=1 Tax=Xenorhabdus nematophila TaxID=628 RepID=UPI00057115C2|nr:ANR family transcriptional regulator [Xenorhabdus nematophila]KHD29294.1 hypothetical protein LH67_04405 [Xenorhabdus nematophila]